MATSVRELQVVTTELNIRGRLLAGFARMVGAKLGPSGSEVPTADLGDVTETTRTRPRAAVANELQRRVGYGSAIDPSLLPRYQRIRKSHSMYEVNDYVRAAIDGMGEDCTPTLNDGSIFKVNWSEDARSHPRFDEVEDLIAGVVQRLGLQADSAGLHSWTLLEGDTFHEVVYSARTGLPVAFEEIAGPAEGMLMKVVREPISQVVLGYVQYDVARAISEAKIVRVFAPWQVVHLSWNPRKWYSFPITSSSMASYQYLADAEAGMARARREGAYEKLGITLLDADVEEIKEVMREQRELDEEKPDDAFTSRIYGSGPIQVLQAQMAGLRYLEDYDRMQKRLWTGLRRPRTLSGGHGEDVNRDTLRRQLSAYHRFTERVNTRVGMGIADIIRWTLMIQAVDVDAVPFSIQWGPRSIEDRKETADTLGIARGLSSDKPVISIRSCQEQLHLDPEEEDKRIAKEEEEAGESFEDQRDKEDQGIAAALAAADKAPAGEVIPIG